MFQRRTSIQRCLIWSKFWFYRFRMWNCHIIQSNWYALDLTCLLVGRTWSSKLWVYSILPIKRGRFKYRFGPQPLVFVSNWSLTLQLCQIVPQPFKLVSKWSLPLNVGWKMLMWLTGFFFYIKNVWRDMSTQIKKYIYMIIKLTCTPSNEIMTHLTFLNKTVDTNTYNHSSFKHSLLTILNQKIRRKKTC